MNGGEPERGILLWLRPIRAENRGQEQIISQRLEDKMKRLCEGCVSKIVEV